MTPKYNFKNRGGHRTVKDFIELSFTRRSHDGELEHLGHAVDAIVPLLALLADRMLCAGLIRRDELDFLGKWSGSRVVPSDEAYTGTELAEILRRWRAGGTSWEEVYRRVFEGVFGEHVMALEGFSYADPDQGPEEDVKAIWDALEAHDGS